ncbi:pyruvate, water dikinase regulatory protein [Acidipropionibacterium acidipropionici]|uniref:pyruvate, water dikinase regulatory protein n=1 Tax=Acidipropionibacterium acidipropionici TaxID=1748 RepID=UPI00041F58F1|nr:pyruvate, water dikinase regulatory protein [Acidipropionibacterium acidipropionici]ALN14113.1 phosphotransferase [Acidipropionibacterium acidipropionici]APZ10122.1 phosphoenolpyruvate synthase regulatory protein [Acidipropionibacterium acidipropionici]
MAESVLEIHVIADSTGETAVRLARAARSQFEGVHWHIVRHSMIGSVPDMMTALEEVGARSQAGQWVCVVHTLALRDMREMVHDACEEFGIQQVDLMGPMLTAMSTASGLDADEVPRRPVGVEADYFTRISAMEFAVRNDDGAIPDRLTEADLCLVGVSRSGKTPLSIYLGYLGYKTVNVPLVPGIAPPKELEAVDRWRIVGLTIDAERLLQIRGRRVRGLGGFGTQDGYADLVKIYDELDEVGRIQRRLGCPVIDTTGLALEEAATRVVDIVEERARTAGTHLRRPAGQIRTRP